MSQPFDHHLAWMMAFLSGCLAFVFNQPAHVVFTAFAGSFLAVGWMNPMTTFKALLLVLVGAFLGCLAVPTAHGLFPNIESRLVACLVAFVTIRFPEVLLNLLLDNLKKWGGAK